MEDDVKKVPFGALEENVADDVPIMASEGEFIIPANVVNFLGLEKIEKMVGKAKEALDAMGEAVGYEEEEVENDDLPFDPSELEGVPHLAEGGEVTAGFNFPQENGYTGVKEYKNADGQSMFIPFVNGQPLYQVPQGYSEGEQPKGGDPKSQAVEKAAETTKPLEKSSSNENGKFVKENKSPLAGNPDDWTVDNFLDFGRNRDSVGNKAVKGMISMMPGGKLAVNAREKWLDKAVSGKFDDILKTGLDPMGNPITPEQRNQLLSTRENLKGQLSKETGLGFDPIESLTNSVSRFLGFTGTGGQVSAPASSLSSEATKMTQSHSKAGDVVNHGGGTDNQSVGGLGSDMGRDPSKGPSTGSMASGGLYAKGGLITRRKCK